MFTCFQIFTCMTDSLIPSFAISPPDVESLRVYLTLPLYHRFANLSNYSSLQTPFCKAILRLKTEAFKVVGMWWSAAPAYYFERLVRIYKSVVLHFVKQSTTEKVIIRDRLLMNKKRFRTFCVSYFRKHVLQIVLWNESLLSALNLLRLLYKLNVSAGMRLPYETFHLAELSQHIDVNRDYLKWMSDEESFTVNSCKLLNLIMYITLQILQFFFSLFLVS